MKRREEIEPNLNTGIMLIWNEISRIKNLFYTGNVTLRGQNCLLLALVTSV